MFNLNNGAQRINYTIYEIAAFPKFRQSAYNIQIKENGKCITNIH